MIPIASNIAFGYQHENIDQKVIEKVSKIANLHEFVINELPKQYQTSVGERGLDYQVDSYKGLELLEHYITAHKCLFWTKQQVP